MSIQTRTVQESFYFVYCSIRSYLRPDLEANSDPEIQQIPGDKLNYYTDTWALCSKSMLKSLLKKSK